MNKVAVLFAVIPLVFFPVLAFFGWQIALGVTVVAELIIIPTSVKRVAKGEYGVQLCLGRIVGVESPSLYLSSPLFFRSNQKTGDTNELL